MDVITLIVVLAVVGLVLWLVTSYVPMPEAFRRALIAIVILLVIVWLLRAVLGVPFPRVTP